MDFFIIVFFVLFCFVFVGVSLIYFVQKFCLDLIYKEEYGRREVYDLLFSIYFVSVVDILSGMFVIEFGVLFFNFDFVEIYLY